MKLFKTLLCAGGLIALAAGCASGPKFSEYRKNIPLPAEGYGRVWFYRPSAMGAVVQPTVKLDDRAVGSAVPRGVFYADTLPGQHEVSATTEWKHKKSLTVSTNDDTYVRLNVAMGLFVGHIVPEIVPEKKATNDMKNLHFMIKK